MRLFTLLVFVPLFAGGCGGGGGTLSGTVTVDGQPLKRGSIQLDPEGGKGTPAGGIVEDGKYTLKDVAAGTYKVTVDGEAATGPTRQEDVMKRSEKEHAEATRNPVPPGAVGNGQPLTVTGGSQTHDVMLTTPGKK